MHPIYLVLGLLTAVSSIAFILLLFACILSSKNNRRQHMPAIENKRQIPGDQISALWER